MAIIVVSTATSLLTKMVNGLPISLFQAMEDGEQGTFDIKPGIGGDPAQWDEDGDGTVIGWRVHNPIICPPIRESKSAVTTGQTARSSP
ncbi:hypothetical protein [Candidatus Villigracilis saccharophilus]|uniref:hypothetical protein n=1 Tax=Candidatus Villigracilis saccharophilus TaxID=3140684 RepID=UPI003136509E|nr:hypothetical protein [Anaerolineales bacterium]